jgi:hypothetical protein
MRRFQDARIGIDHGEVVMFSDFESDGIMWSGEGPRQIRSYVHFSESFVAPPVVWVGLTMWDMSNGSNARVDIGTEDITEDGFAIVFRTWADTRIARARVGWQALGPVSNDELWNV